MNIIVLMNQLYCELLTIFGDEDMLTGRVDWVERLWWIWWKMQRKRKKHRIFPASRIHCTTAGTYDIVFKARVNN